MPTNSAATSRANLVRDAIRPAMPARLMLSGPAGAGKTWTAIEIAREIVGPDGRIIVIDTETESALTYADEQTFEHLPWEPPYDPRQLAATVRDLSEPGTAIIVDSMSHFWHGEGGTLDIVDSKFGGWKVGTPAQDEMVLALLRSKSHVILCVREAQAYAQVEVMENGVKKQKVEKLGLQPKQREGLDYEIQVAASLDIGHTMTVHKTRCRALAGRSYRPNHATDLAREYADWLKGGHPVVTKEQADALRARAMALPGKDENSPLRAECLAEFKVTFGNADLLLLADLDEANALIARFEALVPEPEPEPAVIPPAVPAEPEPTEGPVADAAARLAVLTAQEPQDDPAPAAAPDVDPEPAHEPTAATEPELAALAAGALGLTAEEGERAIAALDDDDPVDVVPMDPSDFPPDPESPVRSSTRRPRAGTPGYRPG